MVCKIVGVVRRSCVGPLSACIKVHANIQLSSSGDSEYLGKLLLQVSSVDPALGKSFMKQARCCMSMVDAKCGKGDEVGGENMRWKTSLITLHTLPEFASTYFPTFHLL
jgi:hypothetical protein